MKMVGWTAPILLAAGLGVYCFYLHTAATEHVYSVSEYTQEKKVPLSKVIGQSLIVGIPDVTLSSTTVQQLRRIRPGGIILYRRNVVSLEQVKMLIGELQAVAVEQDGLPYFIMVDEEPNGASRLDLLKDVTIAGLPNWAKIERGVNTLAYLGVTVDLAPVADFPFVDNSVSEDRVPAGTIEELQAFNAAFVQMLADHRIGATLKHFPGAGMSVGDPHVDALRLSPDATTFDRSLALFRSGIQAGAKFVMINHAVYDHIDPDHPAPVSQAIVTRLLREELGFSGIILTDDIEDMLAPVWNIDPAEAGIRALQAGNTMLMYAHDLSKTIKVAEYIITEAEKDPTLASVMRKNYALITQVKHVLASGSE